jgi:hypothetical protein
MLAPAGTEIDRGRGGLTALTPQPSEDGNECRIAVIAHQEANRDDGLTPTTVQFEPAVRPVRQVVGCAEGRRVHARRENKSG